MIKFIITILLLYNSLVYGNERIVIDGKKNYRGLVEFKGNVIIVSGSEINLSENAILQFSGEIKFKGKKDNKIIIKGENNSIIRFINSSVNIENIEVYGLESLEFIESNGLVQRSNFKRNKVALKNTRNSNLNIENVSFTNNEIAIAIELKSFGKVNKCNFEQNGASMVLAQQGKGEVYNSTFSKNNIGVILNRDSIGLISSSKFKVNNNAIYMYQNIGSKIKGNHFSKNKTAVYGEVYTDTEIESNDFVENERAIDFIQYTGGKIRLNNFSKNGTAIFLEKKSSPDIRNNNFNENNVGVYCNFTSYPVITKNNFINNSIHIKLGEYQSSDFERKMGSEVIQMKEVVERQSKRATTINKNKVNIYSGEVFAKKNYWDEKTLKEMATKDNVSTIYDGYDLKEVTYEGYGDTKYKIDIVSYKPYLTSPVIFEK